MPFNKPFAVVGTPAAFRERASRWFCAQNSLKLVLLVLLVTQTPGLAPAQQFRKALFLHRSVGDCLWDRSKESCFAPPTTIPDEIATYNSNHGYTGSNAVSMDHILNEPAPANNWYDWDAIFGGSHPESSTLYNVWLKSYPIFIVKTGYPAGQFMNEADSLPAYQNQWRRIIRHMADHPENFFVITTNYPAATDKQGLYRSAQSSQFSDWGKTTLSEGNDSFGPFPPNVYVLDWFHMIARDGDGYCDPIYGSAGDNCPYPGGDHPSNLAVAVIDPQFVQQIFDAAIAYENPLAATWAGPPVLAGNLRNRVQVEWQTLSEINTYRFYVQRKGQTWATIDSVNAGGTSLSKRHYTITDSTVTAGTWIYRIKEVDLDGSIHFSQTASATLLANASDPIVTAYVLEQNYPNPFNPSTTIRFGLPDRSHVTLTVFNTLGQQVAVLQNGELEAGYHEVRFDGTNLAGGMYLYRLQAGNYMATKKVVLLR
jgi:hypothetical protein